MGSSVLDTSVAFLKGAGPVKAVVFKEELGIATYADLVTHFPFRYEDRTKLTPLSELAQKTHNVQFLGVVLSAETLGTTKSRQRFVAIHSRQKRQCCLNLVRKNGLVGRTFGAGQGVFILWQTHPLSGNGSSIASGI